MIPNYKTSCQKVQLTIKRSRWSERPKHCPFCLCSFATYQQITDYTVRYIAKCKQCNYKLLYLIKDEYMPLDGLEGVIYNNAETANLGEKLYVWYRKMNKGERRWFILLFKTSTFDLQTCLNKMSLNSIKYNE